MYLVSYLALKNVMKSRQKDYVIMRSIGASKRDLNTITILELTMMMTVAFIAVYGALLGNAIFDFGWPNYLRFYTVFNYIVALSLLLIMMVFLGFRFNKKIFTQTVQTAMRGE
jgi:predicted lysophospholipase L1 biosynthesis ABC-type transport system permease subunit